MQHDSQHDGALARLARLAQPKKLTQTGPPQRGPHKALWLRSRKAEYAWESEKAALQEQIAACKAHSAAVAAFAGIHVPDAAASTGTSSGAQRPHPRSWSALQMLRATFTPVSAGAYPDCSICLIVFLIL